MFPGFSYKGPDNPALAPTVTAANDGTSLNGTTVVLGNDAGLGVPGPGQLISFREIFLNGFGIQFMSGFAPGDIVAVIAGTGFSTSNVATTKNADVSPGAISVADLSGTSARLSLAGGGPQFNMEALGSFTSIGTDASANPAIQISLGIDNTILGSVTPAVDNGVRLQVHGHISMVTATASLDFPNTLPFTSSDLTIPLADAAVNDMVVLGLDPAGLDANSSYWQFVDSPGSVTVRFINSSAVAIDPVARNFTVSILKPL